MIERLYPCPCCGGAPQVGHGHRVVEAEEFPGGTKELRPYPLRLVTPPVTQSLINIHCEKCLLSTPWLEIGSDESEILDMAGRQWNSRVDRVPVHPGTVEDLIEQVVGAEDISLLLALLAKNDGDWEQRGPILSAFAQRVIDATIVTREWWPITPTLEDADRYRKLISLGTVRVIPFDGEGLSFPEIKPSADTRGFALEVRAADAIDHLPERNRW
jgi:hypothetical protein